MKVTQHERCATALMTVGWLLSPLAQWPKQKDIVEPAGAAHCCATFQHLGQLLQHGTSPERPIEGAPLTLEHAQAGNGNWKKMLENSIFKCPQHFFLLHLHREQGLARQRGIF